ncbi:holo-ACP synthase [Lentzea aerocolonigenes]|nr:holo-ACP synthase [Lentzea aerocolonigenes]
MIGIDVLDRTELDRLLSRRWFLDHIYAPEELAYAQNLGPERRREFLAGRFAAKEAVLKSLGTGMLRGIAPRDIRIGRAGSGAPEVELRGSAECAMKVRTSITHKANVVAAVAISQREETMTTASLRVRIGGEEGHYGGGLVDGARVLKLFGDVLTEITVRTDGDEGLLSEYTEVKFHAPVRPGDFIEARGSVVRETRLRRVVELTAHKVIAARPDKAETAAEVLAEPELVCTATATTVVPREGS